MNFYWLLMSNKLYIFYCESFFFFFNLFNWIQFSLILIQTQI